VITDTIHAALLRTSAALAALLFIAATGARLLAPGPAAFVVEPTTGMVLVAIEPGAFVMGSPDTETGRQGDEAQHRVTLTRRIFMGRDEVTQAEWQTVMGTNPSHFADCARCPVEQVGFFEVDDFLTRLTARSTAIRYRLPTEAEWEYACRAGSSSPYSSGEHLDARDANINANPMIPVAPDDRARRTTPVGDYRPNAWGLRDMHGNVWEWTNDFYGPYESRVVANPRGSATGTRRVIRGGSWYFDAASARCALRYSHAPDDKGFSLGFRVVGEPVESAR
jgi:formylglycine-generating enzyme required for sulfatase activity